MLVIFSSFNSALSNRQSQLSELLDLGFCTVPLFPVRRANDRDFFLISNAQPVIENKMHMIFNEYAKIQHCNESYQ